MPTSEELTKCLKVYVVSQFASGLSVQLFLPVLPLLFTEALGKPSVRAGAAFMLFTITALLVIMCQPKLLAKYSVRNILIGSYIVRIVAGLLHGLSLVAGVQPFTETLVFLSRMLHGMSILPFGMAGVYVPMRVNMILGKDNLPKWTGLTQGLFAMGQVLGPTVSSAISATLPDELAAYASPGWTTVVLNGAVLALIYVQFVDYELLPSFPKAAGAELPPVPWKAVAVCYTTGFCICLGYIGGMEAVLALTLKQRYDYGVQDSLPMWLAWAASNLVGFLGGTSVPKFVNWAKLAVVWSAFRFFGLGMLNLFDWGAAPPLGSFLVFFMLYDAAMNFSYLAHLAILGQRLPPQHQMKFQTGLVVINLLGRAIGPVLFSGIYDASNAAAAGTGSNTVLAAIWVTLLAPVLVAIPFFNDEQVYGAFSMPSAAEEAKAASKEMI